MRKATLRKKSLPVHFLKSSGLRVQKVTEFSEGLSPEFKTCRAFIRQKCLKETCMYLTKSRYVKL